MARFHSMYCLVFLAVAVLARLVGGAQFEATSTSVGESRGSVTVILERTDSTVADSINVEIMTLNQFSQLDTSAQGSCQMSLAEIGVVNIGQVDEAEDSDFTAGVVPVEFAAGERTGSLTISVVDDNLAEADELFVAVVSAPDAEGVCALLITLMDDDSITIGFNETEIFVPVASSGTFNGLLLEINGTREREFNIPIQVTSTDAVEGEDFTLPTTFFMVNNGVSNLTVSIGLVDDDIAEDFETFVLCLPEQFDLAGFDVRVNERFQCCTIHLIDDDVTFIGFLDSMEGADIGISPEYVITEGEVGEVCVGQIAGTVPAGFLELAITLTPNQENIGGRASAGSFDTNIGSVPNPTANIQLADGFATDCFPVTAVDNDLVDGDVTFSVLISPTGTTSANDDLVRVRAPNATIRIRDDDVNTFTLALEDSTVSEPLTVEETEGGSLGPITITRNEATIFTYIVTLGTRPNTNVADFTFEPITIEPSMASATVTRTLSVIVDDVAEPPTETYDIIIQNVQVVDSNEGAPQPEWDGRIPVRVVDNDFNVGFENVDVIVVQEGSSKTLPPLGILSPGPDGLQDSLSLPLRLVLQKEGDSDSARKGVSVELRNEEVVLDARNPSVAPSLTVSDDNECDMGPQRYTITFEYMDTDQFTVTRINHTISIEVPEEPDDCAGVMSVPIGMSTTERVGAAEQVCVACIVVPIVIIVIILLLLLCLVLVILLLFCCRGEWWHTYNAKSREEKFGKVRDEYEPYEIEEAI